MDFTHLDRPRRRPPIRALTEVRPDYVLHETVHFQAHPRVNPPLLRTDTLRTPYNEADEDQLESKQPENVSLWFEKLSSYVLMPSNLIEAPEPKYNVIKILNVACI